MDSVVVHRTLLSSWSHHPWRRDFSGSVARPMENFLRTANQKRTNSHDYYHIHQRIYIRSLSSDGVPCQDILVFYKFRRSIINSDINLTPFGRYVLNLVLPGFLVFLISIFVSFVIRGMGCKEPEYFLFEPMAVVQIVASIFIVNAANSLYPKSQSQSSSIPTYVISGVLSTISIRLLCLSPYFMASPAQYYRPYFSLPPGGEGYTAASLLAVIMCALVGAWMAQKKIWIHLFAKENWFTLFTLLVFYLIIGSEYNQLTFLKGTPIGN